MISKRTFLAGVVLACAAAFAFSDGLHQEPEKDETHFLHSSYGFRGAFGLEALRDYPELVTPLALVIWGELDHLTGDGLYYGRLLNLALTFAMVCLVAFCAPKDWPRGALAALGLLLFPYTLPLGVHLYTDTLAVFAVVAGTVALARSRPVLAWVAFSCAIATRQYTVQIPAALAAAEALGWLRGERERWKAVAACGAACATLLDWIAFYGGLANEAGIEDWVGFYPAPMMHATEFLLDQGLYALAGLGVFFVAVEAVLFRCNPVSPELRSPRGALLALALAGLFWLDPPVLTANHPGGPIGRAALLLLPAPDFDWARVAIYYALALLAVGRFAARIDAGFWLVSAVFLLAMKQQLPWEKYLFPTLAVLWTLVSLGRFAITGRPATPAARPARTD
jgi:hypothetical protein